MPIKTIMNEPSELSQILALLNKLDTDVRATNKRLEAETEENKKKFEKWDERYFQLVKDQGNTARTIIIAAASVVILSPVLGAVADLVKNHLNW
ncbi:MAG: hypothetical protein QNJ65_19740 [Xenococcaceae cyanobacterium MO_234.B1]|nr:hypothetical protein [Xenococcaceae cyanobacterium MO_234.B1]